VLSIVDGGPWQKIKKICHLSLHIFHKMLWRRHPSQFGHGSCQKIRHLALQWPIFDNTVLAKPITLVVM